MSMKIKKLSLYIIMLIIWVGVVNNILAKEVNSGGEMHEVQFLDQKPYIDAKGRIMVPIQFLKEAFQGKIEWSHTSRQAKIIFQEEIIYLTVGSNEAVKSIDGNKKNYDMGTQAVLNEGRVFVPLRFFSQTMGYEVVWHEKERVVVIDKKWIIDLSNKASVADAQLKNEKGIQIKYLFSPQGVFVVGETVMATIILQNKSNDTKEVGVRLSYKGPTEEKYELPAQQFIVPLNETVQQEISWTIPKNIISGNYEASVELWDRPIEQADKLLLGKKTSTENFMIYHHIDEFEDFDTKLWKSTNHTLGRTDLKSKNVSVEGGKLRIHMPAGTFEGGEVQSKELLGFGTYEIRMKLPHVPSSITGFFLYRAPDLYHEIDIEVYNEKQGEFFLTTYAQGEKKNLYEGKVPFDLTDGYHNYKIEYYPEGIRFYIDDRLIKAWTNGFTKEKMYLLVNVWYPSWLKGIHAKEQGSYLEIDWIRY